jgi:hypothetical protein
MSFTDAWLAAGIGHKDFKDLRGDQDFRPQAVRADSSSDAGQETAGYCVIDGTLYGENDSFRKTRRIPTRTPVGLAFRKVWAAGTTARGLEILTEQ